MKTITFLQQGEECLVDKVRNYKTSSAEGLRFWKGTIAEYNAISTKDANTLYIIED